MSVFYAEMQPVPAHIRTFMWSACFSPIGHLYLCSKSVMSDATLLEGVYNTFPSYEAGALLPCLNDKPSHLNEFSPSPPPLVF